MRAVLPDLAHLSKRRYGTCATQVGSSCVYCACGICVVRGVPVMRVSDCVIRQRHSAATRTLLANAHKLRQNATVLLQLNTPLPASTLSARLGS
jgi:hypothetical protein